MTRRIAIIGPESTGKSDLAKALAGFYKTVWVPEFAREYLNDLEMPYDYNDILLIAKGQLRAEKKMVEDANQFLFIDTEMIVLKIWCEVKYGKCHSWILEQIDRQNYDLYLLTDIDLPWQPDPLREHPDKRSELFNLYLVELKKYNFPYEVVTGIGEQRVNNAISMINNRMAGDSLRGK